MTSIDEDDMTDMDRAKFKRTSALIISLLTETVMLIYLKAANVCTSKLS